MTPSRKVIAARRKVKPTLVYWHCVTWWALEDGPDCPMEHDNDKATVGRKRRAWICNSGEGGIAYLSRQDFLEHDEEDCYGG